jgi:hypothetical protein
MQTVERNIAFILGKPEFYLNPDDYILHEEKDWTKLKEMYENNGFETRFILQNAKGHKGPTVACPIGFPSTCLPHSILPHNYEGSTSG